MAKTAAGQPEAAGTREQGSDARAAPLVDAHAHIYDDAMPMPETAWHTPIGDAPLERYLETLDAAGVHFGVLAAASIFGDYNDYALRAVRAHRRLRTTVIVPPEIEPYALREMDCGGAVGIRLQFRNVETPPDLSSYPYRKLLRRVADLGWHVHLHDDGERLPRHIEAIEAAGPRLVIDHFGRPDRRRGPESEGFKAVLRAVQRGRAWVKLSAGFRLEDASSPTRLAEILLREAGTERLLWGSDWPFAAFEGRVSYAAALDQYFALVPDAAQRHAIDRTALKFYFG